MEGKEVRELLQKRGGGKMDGYLRVEARLREGKSDLCNLLQVWLHALLHSRNIYPREAFQEREVLGVTVYAVSSPPLKQYLDDFFGKVRTQLRQLNYIRMVVYASGSVVETNTLFIDDLTSPLEEEDSKGTSSFHRDMHIKTFLSELQLKLHQSQLPPQTANTRTFKLRVGLRESEEGGQTGEGWVACQRTKDVGQIACSLKLPTLNLIYEVFR
jgi:hypothetical protein